MDSVQTLVLIGVPTAAAHLKHCARAVANGAIVLVGTVIYSHMFDDKPKIFGLVISVEHVTCFSRWTLIGRQDARTLLYNIRSSVERCRSWMNETEG